MSSFSPPKKIRGFHDWAPKDATVEIIGQVDEILQAYRAHWPLTIRQIFYRLVASYNYDKTELAYERLINYIGRARRAQMIPFDAIRDDGATSRHNGGYDDLQGWAEMAERIAAGFKLARMNPQPLRIEIFCEANGMLPLIGKAVEKYGVSVYSGGGFNSLTSIYDTAQRIMDDPRDTAILNFGDHDPSGHAIFEAFRIDVWSFCVQQGGGREKVDFERVALTQEQVDDMKLPTAPPKKSDSRSKNWVGDTCQLEAIPPDDLVKLAQTSVEDLLDMKLFEETLEQEEELRETAQDAVKRMLDGMIID